MFSDKSSLNVTLNRTAEAQLKAMCTITWGCMDVPNYFLGVCGRWCMGTMNAALRPNLFQDSKGSAPQFFQRGRLSAESESTRGSYSMKSVRRNSTSVTTPHVSQVGAGNRDTEDISSLSNVAISSSSSWEHYETKTAAPTLEKQQQSNRSSERQGHPTLIKKDHMGDMAEKKMMIEQFERMNKTQQKSFCWKPGAPCSLAPNPFYLPQCCQYCVGMSPKCFGTVYPFWGGYNGHFWRNTYYIKNERNNRYLYAQQNFNMGNRVGACPAGCAGTNSEGRFDDEKWKFEKHDTAFFIVNDQNARRMYSQDVGYGRTGVGAVQSHFSRYLDAGPSAACSSCSGSDQLWRLVDTDWAGEYFIQNNRNARRLYATPYTSCTGFDSNFGADPVGNSYYGFSDEHWLLIEV